MKTEITLSDEIGTMHVTANDLHGLHCRAQAAREKSQTIEIGPDLAEALVRLALIALSNK